MGSKYLNSRYYSLPAGVTIRAREGWLNPREDRDRNILRRVVGQQKYLQDHSEADGELAVTGAVVRWWILRDDKALSQNSGLLSLPGMWLRCTTGNSTKWRRGALACPNSSSLASFSAIGES